MRLQTEGGGQRGLTGGGGRGRGGMLSLVGLRHLDTVWPLRHCTHSCHSPSARYPSSSNSTPLMAGCRLGGSLRGRQLPSQATRTPSRRAGWLAHPPAHPGRVPATRRPTDHRHPTADSMVRDERGRSKLVVRCWGSPARRHATFLPGRFFAGKLAHAHARLAASACYDQHGGRDRGCG